MTYFVQTNISDGGKFLFSNNPSLEEKQYGKTYFLFFIESILFFSVWYPAEKNGKMSNYVKMFDNLLSRGITF